MQIGCARISWGFVLLSALLFYLDDGGLFFWLFLASLIHEIGHMLFIWLLGGRITSLVCGGFGFSLYASGLSYGKEIAAALAGPAFSLVLALTAAFWGRIYPPAYRLAGVSLSLGLFNLLPASALDGGRVIRLFLLSKNWYKAAQKSAVAGTLLCALLMGYWAVFYNMAFWLGFSGILFTAIQERKACMPV